MLSSTETENNSTKNNQDIDNKNNNYIFISTYNIGKIGIKKLTDKDNLRPHSNNDSKKILYQNYHINNNITSNNTNANTNSNTNNNSSKNRNIQTSKKKSKNSFSVTSNRIHIQSSSSSKYYKRYNEILNISTKNRMKSSLNHIKFINHKFSKSSGNFYMHSSNNEYISKINLKYLSKKKKSKSSKLIKERKRKIEEKKVKSYTNIFSLITPKTKKYNKYNRVNLNLKINEKNKISFNKTDHSVLNSQKNFSCSNINSDSNKLLISDKDNNSNDNNLNNYKPNSFVNNTQVNNDNYLRVRKRTDFIKSSDIINLNSESSTPASNSNLSKINIPSLNPSLILNDKKPNYDEEFNSEKKNENKNCLVENSPNNNKLNNIIKNSPERNLNNDNNNNIKAISINLAPKKLKNEDKKIDINNIKEKYNIKNNKENKSQDKDNKNFNNYENEIKIKKFNNNNIIQKYMPKIIESKKNINENAYIQLSNKINNKYLSHLNKINTEGNYKNYKISNNRNLSNKKYSASSSKNKYKNKGKNFSLSSSKKSNITQTHISNKYKYKPIKMQGNRYKSNENKKYENKLYDISKKMLNIVHVEEKKENKNEIKNELDFDSPEELHFFIIKLNINYKDINKNF